LLSHKENNERLKKNMKTCVYFCKISHYDANFAAANFFLECKLCKSIRMNYENANIRKLSLRIQKAKFAHACRFSNCKIDHLVFNHLKSKPVFNPQFVGKAN
jgi:hypothetical protein